MAAVKNNGESLRYASDKLKADKEVIRLLKTMVRL